MEPKDSTCCSPTCACNSNIAQDAKIEITGIESCARCGGNHEQSVWFFKFTYPIQDSNGTLWTHWAVCPTNGEPILAKIGEVALADS